MGELAQGLAGMLGGTGWAPLPQMKGLLETEMIGTSSMASLMDVHTASAWLPPGMGRPVLPMGGQVEGEFSASKCSSH